MKLGAPLSLAACVVLSAGCTAPPVSAPKCRQVALASMGPETGFRMNVPPDRFGSVDGPNERIDLALSVVPPLAGPVSLVQIVEGKELARWELSLPAPEGIATRCSIGTTSEVSTCDVIVHAPHPLAGYYALETRGNTVLEAGLSFYLCD